MGTFVRSCTLFSAIGDGHTKEAKTRHRNYIVADQEIVILVRIHYWRSFCISRLQEVLTNQIDVRVGVRVDGHVEVWLSCISVLAMVKQ